MDGNYNNGMNNNYPYDNGNGYTPGADLYNNNVNTMPYNNAVSNVYDPNMNAGYNAGYAADPGYAATPGYNAGFAISYDNDWNQQPVAARSKKGIPALILGIVTLCLFWCWILIWLCFFPIATGIVAIVLGAVGRKHNHSDGKALAGMIMGIVGIALPAIIVIIAAIAVAANW